MAASKTESKVNFIKTDKASVNSISSASTLIGDVNMVNSSIVANTNNNYLAIAGTTFIPENPKFTDTKYNINVTDDVENDLVKISLVAN